MDDAVFVTVIQECGEPEEKVQAFLAARGYGTLIDVPREKRLVFFNELRNWHAPDDKELRRLMAKRGQEVASAIAGRDPRAPADPEESFWEDFHGR